MTAACWERALEAAVELKEQGSAVEAIAALRLLLTDLRREATAPDRRPAKRRRGTGSEALGQQVVEVAERAGAIEAADYELALLLHGSGQHAEGDKVAAGLGFTHRLSDAVFDGGPGGKSVARAPPGRGLPGVLVYDGAVAAELQAKLLEVFGAESDFWPRHGDHPPCPSPRTPLSSSSHTRRRCRLPDRPVLLVQ